MLSPAPSITSDTAYLIQLLTGGQGGHVTVICANGEIRINNFVLVSLYTILGSLVRDLKWPNVIWRKELEIAKEDLVLLFHGLYQQITEFSPKGPIRGQYYLCQPIRCQYYLCQPIRDQQITEFSPKGQIIDSVLSHLGTQKNYVDSSQGEESTDHDNFDLDPVSAVGYITEDHNYLDKDNPPIVIRIKRPLRKKTCHICGKEMSLNRIEKHLLRHQQKEKNASEVSGEKKSCQYCGKLVRCIRDHVRDRCPALQYEEATCKECGRVCRSEKYLRLHMKNKHGDKKKTQCICNICGKVLGSKGSLIIHHKAMHEIRELKSKCEQCGKLCVNELQLKHHMRNHEEKETCPLCGLKIRSLKLHMGNVHTKDEDKKFQCQDCGKGFNFLKKLDLHRLSMHLKTKPYNCRYGCDISYNDFSNRNSHEKKTHGKLFTTAKEERLKEKIELLGVDKETFSNPII